MEIVPPFVPPLVDHTRYFHHAPAHPRVAANMFGLTCGYAAVCLLAPLTSAEGATLAGCGVRLAVLYMAAGTPLLLTRQFQAQLNRRSY